MIKAWAVKGPKQPLGPYEYDPGPLGAEEVEIAVESCGICHSDLSIINNEWGISTYPVVPGHEVIGRVVAIGPQAKGVTVGQPVGVGWGAASCMLSPMPLGRPEPLRPECSYHRGPQGGLRRSATGAMALGDSAS